ncbi:hypothetical protein [Cognatiluteimonas profundi]|uniref:hypothetical protein n=1 Tax=Cognatiluteimonas profundi TaxID=2594501 RepID=UPI00131E8589|nr:hypothetical protein [Lysobacter profundi]
MDNPYLDRELSELAQACDERAGELQARAWHSEAERNALREATADLLSAVARQLASAPLSGSSPANATDAATSSLSAADLRTIIDTRVCHQPLHASPTHTWVRDFAPGGDDRATGR